MVMASQATISIIHGVICSWRLELGITVGIVHVIQHARVLAPELVFASALMVAVFLDVKVQQAVWHFFQPHQPHQPHQFNQPHQVR